MAPSLVVGMEMDLRGQPVFDVLQVGRWAARQLGGQLNE